MSNQSKTRQLTGRALQSNKVRFVGVGVINTLVDIIILNILHYFGLVLFVANIISTSVAMTVSFLLNRRFVFGRGSAQTAQQLLLFFSCSIFTQWFIQGAIVQYGFGFVQSIVDDINHFAPLPDGVRAFLAVNGAKVAAILVGTVTNYLLYSRLVFRTKSINWEWLWPKK